MLPRSYIFLRSFETKYSPSGEPAQCGMFFPMSPLLLAVSQHPAKNFNKQKTPTHVFLLSPPFRSRDTTAHGRSLQDSSSCICSLFSINKMKQRSKTILRGFPVSGSALRSQPCLQSHLLHSQEPQTDIPRCLCCNIFIINSPGLCCHLTVLQTSVSLQTCAEQ